MWKAFDSDGGWTGILYAFAKLAESLIKSGALPVGSLDRKHGSRLKRDTACFGLSD